MNTPPSALEPSDLERLRWATRQLEHPSLAARLSRIVGTPMEIAAKRLARPIFR